MSDLLKAGEITCGNCFWFSHRGLPFGDCRNPRNAEVGYAGSDYNSSNLLRPAYVAVNKVCDLHEPEQASTIREVFKMSGKSVPRPMASGFAGYTGYDIEWERDE